MTEARLQRIQAVTRHYSTLRGGVMRVIWLAAVFAGAYGRGSGPGLIDLGLLWKTLGRLAPSEDGVADVS